MLGWGRNCNMYVVDIVLYSTKGMIIGRKLRQRISVVPLEFLESNRKKAGKFYQSNDFYVFTPQKKAKAMILFYTFYLARGTSWWNRGLQNGRRRQVAGRAGTGLPTTKTIYSRPWTIVRRCRPCRMRSINRGESSSLRRYRDLQNYHRRPADRRTGTEPSNDNGNGRKLPSSDDCETVPPPLDAPHQFP